MATGGREDSRGTGDSLKLGTPVPNRIFVGGISACTNEEDLKNLFSRLGNVKAANIILDKSGISRGYGFVTFETEEEATKVLEIEGLNLNGRKLNVAQAFKKQPYNRSLATHSVHNSSIVWPTQTFSENSGYSRDQVYYPQAAWPPVMWPQHYFLQHCNYPQQTQGGYPQYVYSLAPVDYQYPSANAVATSDYAEVSADNEAAPKARLTKTTLASDLVRPVQAKQQASSAVRSPHRYSPTETPPTGNFVHSPPFHHLPHPVYAKTVNGMTVMAYPSVVMGSPTLLHVRDSAAPETSENVVTELSFLQTPPSTPLAQMPCDFNANNTPVENRKN